MDAKGNTTEDAMVKEEEGAGDSGPAPTPLYVMNDGEVKGNLNLSYSRSGGLYSPRNYNPCMLTLVKLHMKMCSFSYILLYCDFF